MNVLQSRLFYLHFLKNIFDIKIGTSLHDILRDFLIFYSLLCFFNY